MSDTQTPPSPQPAGKPRRKWVKVVLAISLTLNLLVIGLVAGAKFGDHRYGGFNPHGPERGSIKDAGFGPVLAALPPKDRRAVGRALRAQKGTFEEGRKQMREDLNKILMILRAEDFDAVALDAVLDAQRDRMMSFGMTARHLIMDRINMMSYDERKEFADAILRNIRKERRKVRRSD